MIAINLIRGETLLVDEEAFETAHECHLVNGESMMLVPSSVNWTPTSGRKITYAVGHTPYRSGVRHPIKLHRLLLSAKPGMMVDHKDGNGLNNTMQNIRLATAKQNAANARVVKNATGFVGIFKGRKPGQWVARLRDDDRFIQVGTFDSIEKAIAARNAEVIRRRGEFAFVQSVSY